ncbi:MAG: diguanylate cyclase [Planctomycetes bacterium]|nr:diguanylate cyclase [Planctomycetota bacterium]
MARPPLQKPLTPLPPGGAPGRAPRWFVLLSNGLTRNLSLAVAIAVCGLGLTALLFLLLRQAEADRFTHRFHRRASERVGDLRRSLEHEVELLRAVAAVLDASEAASAPLFERVVERGLGEVSDFRSIAWLRRVRGLERAAFEAGTLSPGDAARALHELDGEGRPVAAARREEHYPVVYCVSREGDAAQGADLGLDYAAFPERREALERAARSGTLLAAGPLPAERDGAPSLWLFQPLYAGDDVPTDEAQREVRLEGFAAAVLPIAPMLQRALASDDLTGIRLFVWAGGDSRRAPQPVFTTSPEPPESLPTLAQLESDPQVYLHDWELCGLQWRAIAVPVATSRDRDGLRWSWLALLSGLFLTAAATNAAARVSGERRRLSHEVRQFWRLSAEMLAVADRHGVLRRCNPAWATLLGRGEEEVVGRSLADLVHPEDRPATLALIGKLQKGAGTLQFDARLRNGAGRWRWFQWSVAPDESSDAIHAVARDVTEQRQTLAELERRATIDPLTNVLTRRALFERLGLEIRRAKRYGSPLSLAVLDLDRFKEVNDQHGHGTGDELLRRLGTLLRKSLRETDLAGRIGGDEFVVVMPQTDLDDARRAAARVLRAFHDDPGIATAGGERLPVRASLGVATLGPDVKDAAALVALADEALYDAKGKGRGRVA